MLSIKKFNINILKYFGSKEKQSIEKIDIKSLCL